MKIYSGKPDMPDPCSRAELALVEYRSNGKRRPKTALAAVDPATGNVISNLVTVNHNGTLTRCIGVNPKLGLKLTTNNRVALTDNDTRKRRK